MGALALLSFVGSSVSLIAGESVPASDLLRLPERLVPGLDQAVATALAHSPVANENELKLLEADANRDAANAAVLPRVNAHWDGYLRQEERRDRAGSQSGFKQWYDVSVEQPLFHWGALANQKRIGEIRRAIAQGETQDARRKLLAETRRQYGELITRRLELDVLRASLGIARRDFSDLESQGARGEIATEALELERLNIAQRALELERAEQEFAAAVADFARFVGVARFDAASLPRELPALPIFALPVDTAPPSDARSSAALARAADELQAAQLAYEIERTRLRPKLNLAAGTSLEEVNYSANVAERYGVTTHYAGVRVQWPIFDGYLSRAAVQQARVGVRRAERSLSDVREDLTRQLVRERGECERAQRELGLTEARFRLQSAAFVRARGERDAGGMAARDFERRELEHERQRIALVRARLQVLLRAAEFALLHETAHAPLDAVNFP